MDEDPESFFAFGVASTCGICANDRVAISEALRVPESSPGLTGDQGCETCISAPVSWRLGFATALRRFGQQLILSTIDQARVRRQSFGSLPIAPSSSRPGWSGPWLWCLPVRALGLASRQSCAACCRFIGQQSNGRRVRNLAGSCTTITDQHRGSFPFGNDRRPTAPFQQATIQHATIHRTTFHSTIFYPTRSNP